MSASISDILFQTAIHYIGLGGWNCRDSQLKSRRFFDLFEKLSESIIYWIQSSRSLGEQTHIFLVALITIIKFIRYTAAKSGNTSFLGIYIEGEKIMLFEAHLFFISVQKRCIKQLSHISKFKKCMCNTLI